MTEALDVTELEEVRDESLELSVRVPRYTQSTWGEGWAMVKATFKKSHLLAHALDSAPCFPGPSLNFLPFMKSGECVALSKSLIDFRA